MYSVKSMKGLILAGMIGLGGLLAGCGGGGAGGNTATGGGTSTPPPPTTTVTGTAATGAAMAGATVTVKDATGATVVTTSNTTAADGSYTLSIANPANYTAPFLLRADPTPANPTSGDEHYSILLALDTVTPANNRVNITPITSLLLYEVTKKSVVTVFNSPQTYLPGLASTDLTQAQNNIIARFPQLNGLNFLGQSFAAANGDSYDDALEAITFVSLTFNGDAPVLKNGSGVALTYDAYVPLYPIATVTVAAGGATQTANGASFNLITASVTNTLGQAAKNVTVNFTTSAGGLWTTNNVATAVATTTAVTDSTGVARLYLKAPILVGTAMISASSSDNAAQGSTTVTFVPGAPAAIGLNAQPSVLAPGGSTTLTAVVTDANGNLVSNNENITFSYSTAGSAAVGGNFSGAPIVNRSTSNGIISLTYTAGNVAGTETIVATATNGTTRTFPLSLVVGANAISSLSLTSSSASIPANNASTVTLTATARNSSGAGVPGAVVVFSTTAGSFVGSSSVTTDANGVASVTLKSGTVILTAKASASVNGYTNSVDVNFTAGTAAAIGSNASPSSVRPGGTSTLTVAVVDSSGNPVAGEPVSFTIPTKNSGVTASLSAASAVTNASGLATVVYTAGVGNGTDTIRATLSNGTTKDTTINVNAANAVIGSLVATAINPSIPVSTGATVIRATVRDTSNAVLPGITVNFASSAGTFGAAGTSVTTTSATTDANGIASVTLTAGSSVLTATVEASANGVFGSAQVNFIAGAANSVTLTAAPNAVRPGGTSSITALVRDATGNPVLGESVALSISSRNSGAPSLGVVSGTTNANGMLTFTYTAGLGEGTDTVTALSGNGKSGTVNIGVANGNAVIGSVAATSTSTSITVGGTTQIRATVLDSLNQPVVGGTVTFVTTAGTFGAAGTTESTTTGVTDANGVATATLRAGSTVLAASVVASVSGFSSSTTVNFTAGAATSVSLLASPNAVMPGGSSALTVLVRDNAGNVIAGENVTLAITTFSSGAPSLNVVSGQTSANGILALTYTAGATSSANPDVVRAVASNGVSGSVNISVNTSNAVVGSVAVSANSPAIPISGSTVVQATVRDTLGAPLPNVTVNFVTSAGTFGAAGTSELSKSATSNASGVASVTLTAGGTVLTAQVGASAGGFSGITAVNFTAGMAAAVAINATPSTVAPSGTSSVIVAVTDSQGNAVANEPVALSLPVVTGVTNSGNRMLSIANGTTNANGLLVVTYTAGAGAGTDRIKAVVSTGYSDTEDISVSATTSVIGSLTTQATNPSIPVGSGSTQIRATVRDSAGATLSGVTVAFATRGGVGTLSAASAVTDANGIASTTLTGPAITVAQAVRVDATVSGFNSSTTVNFIAGAPATIGLNASPNAVKPAGTSVVSIAVVDGNGNAVSGEAVSLSFSSSGSGTPTLSATTGTTNDNGLLLVTYTAGNISGGGDVIRAVTSNGRTNTATISVNSSNIVVGSVMIVATSPGITVGGTTTIRATVLDSVGNPVPNYPVTFKTSAGSITASASTDNSGLATATLTAGAQLLTATVTAMAGGVPGSTTVSFIAGVASTLTLSAAPTTVSPGGSSTLTAYVVDSAGNPVAGETVNFTLPTKNSGLPVLIQASAVTNSDGIASVVYTAGNVGNPDKVDTARAATVSNGVADTENITVSSTATVVGSITLTTGASTLPADGTSTTVLRATVLTSAGAPASGIAVTFASSGGSIVAGSVTTNASGIAEKTLTSPTRTGTITVTASASGFFSSQNVTIIAGQPTDTKFAITASPASVTASGLSTVTAIVLDANDNPVVGQTVTFTITTNSTNATLSPVTAITSASGIATASYTGGNTLGTDTLRAALVGGLSKTTTVTVSGGTLNALSIGTSQTTINSDNSGAAAITVTALSSQNVVVPGVTISFSANGGQLSASQAVTDANGKATVSLSSGTQNKSNRVVTVSATAAGIATPVQIPVQVVGSTASLTTTASTLTAGGGSATVTVTARDASGLGIYNIPVTLSQSGTGSLTIAQATGNTDVNGQFTTTVSGLTSGTATLTASALAATASQTFTVLPGSTFGITAPAGDPASMSTGGTLAFSVTAPAPATQVRFASTIGTWSVCPGGTAGGAVCTATVAAGTASATLTSSNSGIANIQVDGLDGSGNVTGTDTHSVAITATTASTISLQASAANVQPSTGGTANTVTLIATVRDASGQPVGNVPVAFSLVNTTGGGESINPVIRLSSDGVTSTDPLGQARSTFTSGTLPSGQSSSSIQVSANVVGTATAATVNIVVGGTAGSVVIGQSTTVAAASGTQYTYPMSVLVADANGSPVPAGTVVSLSIWPVEYAQGHWRSRTLDGLNCVPTGGPDPIPLVDADGDGNTGNDYAGITYVANEDANENLVRDAGESVTLIPGVLTPPNSAAGTLPASVVTDANGVANFNLVYLKQYAAWIKVRVRASTLVQGTEASSLVYFGLPYLKSEADACILPHSPFNP